MLLTLRNLENSEKLLLEVLHCISLFLSLQREAKLPEAKSCSINYMTARLHVLAQNNNRTR